MLAYIINIIIPVNFHKIFTDRMIYIVFNISYIAILYKFRHNPWCGIYTL